MDKCFFCKTRKRQKYGSWVTQDLEIKGAKARINISFLDAWICKSCALKILEKVKKIFK